MAIKKEQERNGVIDGFRAVVHVSLIALHSAMLTSGHLPSEGPVWLGVKKNLIYTFFQAGGTQVDLMFMLSGYLLVHKMLNEHADGRPSLSTIEFGFRRALRFIPPLIAVSIIGVVLGDTWDGASERGEVPAIGRILSFLAFVANYIPPSVVGCFTLSLCWSCCVDLHAGILLSFIIGLGKAGLKKTKTDGLTLAFRLRWVFLALTIASMAIRALLFEPNSLNLFRLGQYSHFGLLQTDISYSWIQGFYKHTWLTKNTAVDLAQGYLEKMYNPTHTRIGPFFVGGVVACNVFLAVRSPPKSKTFIGVAFSWLFTLQALVTLVLPCLPPEDDVPMVGQWIATAAVRTLSSAAAGFLLYRALVPAEHGWHWKMFSSVLSNKIFSPIATLSYCSYLVHFRLLMELCFRRDLHAFVLSLPPHTGAAAGSAKQYIEFIPKLFVLGFIGSMAASFVLYNLVEKPCAKAISRLLPGPSSRNAVSNSDLLKLD